MSINCWSCDKKTHKMWWVWVTLLHCLQLRCPLYSPILFRFTLKSLQFLFQGTFFDNSLWFSLIYFQIWLRTKYFGTPKSRSTKIYIDLKHKLFLFQWFCQLDQFFTTFLDHSLCYLCVCQCPKCCLSVCENNNPFLCWCFP